MHNTHVILVNEENFDKNLSYIHSMLDGNLTSYYDYYTILGAIDLKTGEYLDSDQNTLHISSKIRSISDLEAFANSLYNKEMYDGLKRELERLLKSEYYWMAASICKRLDGIAYPVKMNLVWKADNAFGINDNYFDMEGITDWRIVQKHTKEYAVIIDFHS